MSDALHCSGSAGLFSIPLELNTLLHRGCMYSTNTKWIELAEGKREFTLWDNNKIHKGEFLHFPRADPPSSLPPVSYH